MDKESLLKVFEELLEEWHHSEMTVINDRGSSSDQDVLKKDEDEYRRRFKEALGE